MNLSSDHAMGPIGGCLDSTLIGSLKLGQPVLLSNFLLDSNSEILK
jgi:hypothetical protein